MKEYSSLTQGNPDAYEFPLYLFGVSLMLVSVVWVVSQSSPGLLVLASASTLGLWMMIGGLIFIIRFAVQMWMSK